MRRRLAGVALAAGLAGAAPLHAQARADSTLAAALAATLAPMAERESEGAPVLLVSRDVGFDSVATAALYETEPFRRPPYDVARALVVRLRGVRLGGDTASIEIETSRCGVRFASHAASALRFVSTGAAGYRFVDQQAAGETSRDCRAAIQTPADSAALAKALATVLLRSSRPEVFRDGVIASRRLGPVGQRLVAELRQRSPAGRAANREHALSVEADAVTTAGELTTVTLRTARVERGDGLNSWSNTTAYVFAREGDGYALAGVLTLDSADGHAMPDPPRRRVRKHRG